MICIILFRSGSYGYGIDNPYAYGMDIESWKSDKMTNVRYKVNSRQLKISNVLLKSNIL